MPSAPEVLNTYPVTAKEYKEDNQEIDILRAAWDMVCNEYQDRKAALELAEIAYNRAKMQFDEVDRMRNAMSGTITDDSDDPS